MIDKSQCGNREHRTLKWVVVMQKEREDLWTLLIYFFSGRQINKRLFKMNLYILVMDKRFSS